MYCAHHGCYYCDKEKKLKEKQRKIFDKYKIIDAHRNGSGWWKSSKIQAEIRARDMAWTKLGLGPCISPDIARYTITPKIAKLMGKDLLYLNYLGKTALNKINSLPENAEELFQKAYKDSYQTALEWAIDFFKVAFKKGTISKQEYEQKILEQ